MWIRVHDGTAEGDLTCAAGHRIPLADGSIDGVHAGWRWAGGRLEVEQDRYGCFPLFEWQGREARMLSTDLRELLRLGAPRALDFDALAVFVRVGFFLGADTPFAAIRAVLPPPLPRRQLAIGRSEAVDGFIDLFRQAIERRRPRGRFLMPLSGGRDSRHILFALRDAGCAPAACVTVRHFPPRANDDELIAAEVCAALGIEHRVLAQPADRVAAERRKNHDTHLCTDEHAQFVALADYLIRETRETYDGIAGDVLSQSTYLRPDAAALFAGPDPEAAAAFVLDGYGVTMTEPALQRVLAPPLLAELPRERAVARLAAEIASHREAANPVGSFFFHNRTRREVALAPFGLMRPLTAYAPYLDRDLYDFLAALPADLLMDRALHSDAIARAWPQYAHLPYERKGAVEEDRWAQRRLAGALATAALRAPARAYLRWPALLPGLAATLADGDARRLWPAQLVLYLSQMAAEAALPSAAAVRER